MADVRTIRPSAAALAVAFGLLPLVAALCVVLAAAAGTLFWTNPVFAIAACVALLLLVGLCGWMLASLLRWYYSIRITDEALTLVSLFALRRISVPWNALEAVGPVGWKRYAPPIYLGLRFAGAHYRAERSAQPWQIAKRWGLTWDQSRKVLIVTSFEGWSVSAEELTHALRRCAAERWVDNLDPGHWSERFE